MRTIVVVSLSLGTGLLIVFCAIVVAVSILLVHPKSGVNAPSFDTPSRVPDFLRPRPLGDMPIGEEAREAELNRNFGPVNKAKQKEDKTGLFSRIRANRQASYGCSGNSAYSRCQPVSYQRTYYSVPVAYYQPRYVSYSTPVRTPTARPVCPDGTCPQQPAPLQVPGEPYREIDPDSCFDGSCALRDNRKQSFLE